MKDETGQPQGHLPVVGIAGTKALGTETGVVSAEQGEQDMGGDQRDSRGLIVQNLGGEGKMFCQVAL